MGRRGPQSVEHRARIAAARRAWHAANPLAQVGQKRTAEARKKMSESAIARKAHLSMVGKNQTVEARSKRSATLRLYYAENPAPTGRRLSAESRRLISVRAKERGASHNWFKDGNGRARDCVRKAEMVGVEYSLWREAVFKRDDFTCQTCGTRGGTLNADHIKPWAAFPESRYSVDNGRTLCVPCHRATPTYGRRPDQIAVSP